jgi:hypothetical protein
VFGQNRSDDHLGQIKDCKIGICCFSAKYAALRRNSKDWFPRNRDCTLIALTHSEINQMFNYHFNVCHPVLLMKARKPKQNFQTPPQCFQNKPKMQNSPRYHFSQVQKV